MPTPQTRTLAMIHTVPGLIATFEPLVRRALPGWASFNMVDESLLKATIRDGVLTPLTIRRLAGMVWSAVDGGADAVLVTCSSLGGAVDALQAQCPVPLFRIDEGMAAEAVASAHRIGVLATLPTTLQPTTDLIRRVAARTGRDCTITSQLADGAFALLAEGDAAGHDALVAQALRDLAPQVDAIVLAQASMARVLPLVVAEIGALPLFTSPEPGITHLAAALTTFYPQAS